MSWVVQPQSQLQVAPTLPAPVGPTLRTRQQRAQRALDYDQVPVSPAAFSSNLSFGDLDLPNESFNTNNSVPPNLYMVTPPSSHVTPGGQQRRRGRGRQTPDSNEQVEQNGGDDSGAGVSGQFSSLN